MKNIILIFFLFISVNICAQSNSAPYFNKSLIKVKYLNEYVESGLEAFDLKHMSCRHHTSNPEIIVNYEAIDWLTEHDIPFEILALDLKSKIDQENEYINLMKFQRDGDQWYNIYRTYDEVQDKLLEIASSSNIATLIDLGNSYENRDIKGIKFSTGGSGKPAVFFNGCQHAREWITVMATTYIADQMAQNYLTNSYLQTLLDIVDVYIVPIVNPDGYIYTHTTDRYWRKNRQPNSGSSCIGTDLNRNWDADWNGGQSTSTSSCSDIYVGSYPFSATEANVLKNYMESIPNLRGHLDIHSYSALVLGPWGYTNAQSPDHAEIVSLGNIMNEAIINTNGYPFVFGTGDANGTLYLASGTMPDWSYDVLGSLGYTYELRPNSASGGGFELPQSQILDACEENYNGALEMIIWAADIQSGCTNPSACNYDPIATVDNGSCAEIDECGDCGGNGPAPGYDCNGNCISGETLTIDMTDSYGDGWNGNSLIINGISFTLNSGSSGSESVCYDPSACVEVSCNGGTWQSEVSWTISNSSGFVFLSGGAPFSGDFNCNSVLGCTDQNAINYNSNATQDDGSCLYPETGCTDPNACNYNPNAIIDDNSCAQFDECGECGGNGPSPGYDCSGNCSNGDYLQIEMYDSYGDGWNGNILTINDISFTIEAGSEGIETICYDSSVCIEVSCDGGSWQSEVSWTISNSSDLTLISGGAPFSGDLNCNIPIPGCTDPTALNYDVSSNQDDGSCIYAPTLNTQSISLPEGWFIFSTYIQPESSSIDMVLSPVLSTLIIAKNGEGLAYLPEFNFNAIGDLSNNQGYLIKLSQQNILPIIGNKIEPESYLITLNSGWNMFSYLRDSSLNLEIALATIQDQIIIVKRFDGTAYLPDWDYNGIGDFLPGEGYQVKLSNSASFYYPEN